MPSKSAASAPAADSSSKQAAEGTPVLSPSRQRKRKIFRFEVLPLDLQFELLSFLGPAELVAASRACKHLHRLIMTPSSGRKLWLDALAPYFDDELPPTPLDLTEPRYAQLLFYARECVLCGRDVDKGIKTDWMLRTRLCFACQKADLVRLDLVLLKTKAVDRIWGAVPSTLQGPPGARQRFGGDELWVSRSRFFATEAALNALPAFEDLDEDRFSDEVIAYRTMARERVMEIRRTAASIEQWTRASTSRRHARDRDARWTTIRNRLHEAGHTDVDRLEDDPLVRRTRTLGAKAWTALLPKLVARLDETAAS